MAVIFLTDGIGQGITCCYLNGRNVGRLGQAVQVNIPAVEKRTDMPPAAGWLECSGSIDILDADSKPVRHYGMIKLMWGNLKMKHNA